MNKLSSTYSEKIKELRIKRKMSQEELAEKIDIAERNLSKIECGKSFIRAEKIAKLAQVLSVEPKDLFDFAPNDNLSDIKQDLHESIDKCSEKEIRILYEIYKIMSYF